MARCSLPPLVALTLLVGCVTPDPYTTAPPDAQVDRAQPSDLGKDRPALIDQPSDSGDVPCPTGQITCAGQCVDLNTRDDHCGGCGNRCATSVANANTNCAEGACRLVSCLAGFDNCDGVATNGCEANTAADVNNCGSCGNRCVLPNATAACMASRCVITSCNANFADCNNNPTDGCETDTRATVAHCGRCGNMCSAPSGRTPLCAKGACGMSAICTTPGTADCDGDPTMSCETVTAASPLHCGGCGRPCSANNGVPQCAGGTCSIRCNAGFADCDGNVNTGCEANTSTSVAHCGGCGQACSVAGGVPSCVSGQCRIACNAGLGDCDGSPANGCESNLRVDGNHCGACGMRCPAPQVCVRGLCVGREGGDLAAGDAHACARVADCNAVFCWGSAASCEFAPTGSDAGTPACRIATPTNDAGTTACPVSGGLPIYTTAQRVTLPGRVRQLTAAGNSTCALVDEDSGGAVYCWGRNGFGQLGDGTTTSRAHPVRVALPGPAVQVDLGAALVAVHACAVLADGSVYCWGGNHYEELGAPSPSVGGGVRTCTDFGSTYNCNPSPVRVSGLTRPAIQVSAGGGHSCALTEDRLVTCWGSNAFNELGVAAPNTDPRPQVPGLTNVVQVAAGSGWTCALRTDGNVFCWGSNGICTLGDSATVANRITPMPATGLSNARQISLSVVHACAALGDGSARCWGYDANNQIGNATAPQRRCTDSPSPYNGVSPPVAVQMLPARVTEVQAGGNFTCAVTGVAEVQCWGANTSGQLGDNRGDCPPAMLRSYTPRLVVGLGCP